MPDHLLEFGLTGGGGTADPPEIQLVRKSSGDEMDGVRALCRIGQITGFEGGLEFCGGEHGSLLGFGGRSLTTPADRDEES